MFPLLVPDERLMPKDYVFALRGDGREQAWPLADFAGGRVINATVGDLPVVLVGDAATRTVRAYQSGGQEFAAGSSPTTLVADGQDLADPGGRPGRPRRRAPARACPATSPTGSPGRASSMAPRSRNLTRLATSSSMSRERPSLP